MTYKEFAKYLYEWLRFDSAEDCCSKCAYCPTKDICINVDGDDEKLCFEGMKKYAEKQSADKK